MTPARLRHIFSYAVLCLLLLTVQSPAKQKKAAPELSKWWICGAGLNSSGPAVIFKLAICSTDKKFTSGLTKESFEVQTPGDNVNILMVIDPVMPPSNFALPYKEIMLISGSGTAKVFQATSLRLKGETRWVSLSEVFNIGENSFALVSCSRCGTKHDEKERKCKRCGAEFIVQ